MDGSFTSLLSVSLVPGWFKARWRNGVLQPAKMYMKASAGPIVKEGIG